MADNNEQNIPGSENDETPPLSNDQDDSTSEANTESVPAESTAAISRPVPRAPNLSTVRRRLDFGEPSEEAPNPAQELESINDEKSQKYNFDFKNSKPLPGKFEWKEEPTKE